MIIFTQNQPITFEHIDAIKEMADKIKRVRELHKPDLYEIFCTAPSCLVVEIIDKEEKSFPMLYPCPTIQALDGEQS